MKKFNRFLENVVYINNSIKVLLNEDGIISPPPDLNTVNEKFTVIEDGKEPKDNEINLKNAKKFKTDAVVGEEIDVPVITFEGMGDNEIEEKFREMISDGDINWKDIEQMAIAGSSGKVRRTAVGAIKVTPKVLAASGRLMLLGKLKKDIPHSQCYCVKLFDDNLDSTLTPPKPSRDVYKDSLSDYLDSVVDEFLEGWDECEKKYDNLIDDKSEREKALDAWWALHTAIPEVDSAELLLVNPHFISWESTRRLKSKMERKKYKPTVAEKEIFDIYAKLKWCPSGDPKYVVVRDDIVGRSSAERACYGKGHPYTSFAP